LKMFNSWCNEFGTPAVDREPDPDSCTATSHRILRTLQNPESPVDDKIAARAPTLDQVEWNDAYVSHPENQVVDSHGSLPGFRRGTLVPISSSSISGNHSNQSSNAASQRPAMLSPKWTSRKNKAKKTVVVLAPQPHHIHRATIS
jgi:hypothetical protein